LADRFARLEEQMCAMAQDGYTGKGSPDRLDSMVHGLTELMLGAGAVSMFQEFRTMRRQSEPSNAVHVGDIGELKDWWPRWISVSVAHQAVAHWWARLPSGRIHAYREVVLKDASPELVGIELAARSSAEIASTRVLPIWLNRAQFTLTGGKSVAQSVYAGMSRTAGSNRAFLMVHDSHEVQVQDTEARNRMLQSRISRMPSGFFSVQPLQGDKENSGWDVVRELLRWRETSGEAPKETMDFDYAAKLSREDSAAYAKYLEKFVTPAASKLPMLTISPECRALIQGMSGATRTEDGGLSGSSGAVQSLRIGALASVENRSQEPMQEFVGRRMENLREDISGLGRFIAATKAEQDWERQHDTAPVSFSRRRR
jgi:hypothetical protein